MANQTVKIKIRSNSRNGNVRNRYILIFTSPQSMNQERLHNARKNLDEFIKSDAPIAVLELPPNSKYSLIKL